MSRTYPSVCGEPPGEEPLPIAQRPVGFGTSPGGWGRNVPISDEELARVSAAANEVQRARQSPPQRMSADLAPPPSATPQATPRPRLSLAPGAAQDFTWMRLPSK